VFYDYLDHGWGLCEIPRGSKGPNYKGWNTPEGVIRDKKKLNGAVGAGLCHVGSGTAALDIDNLAEARPFFKDLGVDLDALLGARDAVQISSGRPNRAKLIYRLATPLPSKKLARYESIVDGKKYHAIELRCAARDGASVQDCLPGTIHPQTNKPYEWKYGDPLVGSWRNLPEIPAALLALWQQSTPEAEEPALPEAQDETADLATLRDYLEYHTDHDTYDTWVNVGMALHKATGGAPEGLLLWDEWSRKSSKYGEAKGGLPAQYPTDKWHSFHTDADGPGLDYLRAPAPAPLAAFPVVAEEFQPPVDEGHGVDVRPGALIRNALLPLVFISSQGMYYDTTRNGLLSMQSVEHLYTPVMPIVHSTGTNGAAKSYQPNPVHELRRATWKEEAFGLGMHPAQGKFFSERGRRFLNTYEDPKIQMLKPTARERETFNFLWTRPDEKVFRNWLLQFYAYAVQHPGEKITSAPLLVGHATGSGKNTLMKILPQLLFSPQYVTVMTNQVLQDKFSDQLANAWWVYFEELHSGSFKGDRIGVANRVKSWITDDTVTVRPMFGKAYDAPNRIQITASSNYEDDAIFVDNSDRRWVIGHIEHGMTEKEGDDTYAFLNSARAPGVLRQIFSEVSLTGFNPKGRAPDTAAKKTMVSVNYGLWESKILELAEGAVPPFDKDIVSTQDLMPFMGNGMTAVRLGRILSRSPFNCTKLPPAYGKRLWCWRNQELWAQMGPRAQNDHHTSGVRPADHPWELGLPAAMSAACGFEPEPTCDLI
jgi:hypothetical protein